MTTPTNTDAWQAFQHFERDGWNDVATVYADLIDDIGLTTGPAGTAILDAAGLQPGERVADVATGPGFLARLAAERGAAIVGVDIAAAMVEEARRRHPQLRFEVGPAERLPLPDGSFDVVVSAWGLPHFADHGQVFLEARRVLQPGGRLAFATWRPPPGNEFFAILLGSLRPYQQHATDLPPGPDLFRYADAAVAERDLAAAGFDAIRCSNITFEIRLPRRSDDLMRFLRAGSVRSQAIYLAQDRATRALIEEQVHAEFQRITQGRPDQHLRLEATVISAVNPARPATP